MIVYKNYQLTYFIKNQAPKVYIREFQIWPDGSSDAESYAQSRFKYGYSEEIDGETTYFAGNTIEMVKVKLV